MAISGYTEISDTGLLSGNPLISVLILAYNHQDFLAEAIDSVLIQSCEEPYEVIIGEDCSCDRTRQIALDYQRRHPDKIRVIFSDSNVGMNENFKRIYIASRGKFIAICEGDDYWIDPCKLTKQTALLKSDRSLSIVFHDVSVVDEFGARVCDSKILDYWHLQREYIISPQRLAVGAAIPTLSVLFRKIDLVFDGIMRVTNLDTYLFACLGQNGSAKIADGVLGAYRVHSGGIWSGLDAERKMVAQIETFSELTKEISCELRPYSALQLGRQAIRASYYFFSRGNTSYGLRYLAIYLKGFGNFLIPLPALVNNLQPLVRYALAPIVPLFHFFKRRFFKNASNLRAYYKGD